MKKIILIIFVTSLFLVGCFGSKSIAEKSNTKETSSKIETKSDSLSKITINQAIDDKVATQIPESGDPVLDSKIDEILNKINTSKSSGSNTYKLYYDKKTREIIAELKIGQTQDSIARASNSLVKEDTTIEIFEEYIKKKIYTLPWWAYAIVIFLLRKQILGILGFFIPGLGAIKTIKDLTLKKKNANQPV